MGRVRAGAGLYRREEHLESLGGRGLLLTNSTNAQRRFSTDGCHDFLVRLHTLLNVDPPPTLQTHKTRLVEAIPGYNLRYKFSVGVVLRC